MYRKILASAVTVLLASAGVVATAVPAAAAGGGALSAALGFSVLTEGDLVTTGSAHEVEGSAAIGGDLVVDKAYILGAPRGTLPVVAGRSTQLLVGGAVDLNAAGEAIQVNQGATRVGDPTGYTVNGKQYHPAGDDSRRLRMAADATLADVHAPGLFASTFAGAFAGFRATSSAVAGYQASAVELLTLIDRDNFNGLGQNDKGLELVAGEVNLLRVTPEQLAGIENIQMKGANPSATTPLLIDVIVPPDGVVPLVAPKIMNIDPAFVLWNFSGATQLSITTKNSGYLYGSILAPDASVHFDSGYIEGQVVVKSFRISSNGEIHGIGFVPELPERRTAAASYSFSNGSCETGEPTRNSITVDAVPGVLYTWVSGGSGTFTSHSDSDAAPGFYSFTAAGVDGYTVTETGPFTHDFPAAPADCRKAEASASIVTAPATCAAAGTVAKGTIANATWGDLTVVDGEYRVTASAAAGFKFPPAADSDDGVTVSDDGTTMTFSGAVEQQRTGPECVTIPDCIPSNAVSYTYDRATNSGVITVADVPSASGELCAPFWVTATSWVFTGATVWPQARDVVDYVNDDEQGKHAISTPGQYPYSAPVGCGQGDIYASFAGQPEPTADLYGPDDPFDEHFLHQMGFTGPTPTYVVDEPGCNEAVPAQPIVTTVGSCGTTGSVTAGPTDGVVYAVEFDQKSGLYTVTATPAANRYLAGDDDQKVVYTGTVGAPYDCVDPTEPQPETRTVTERVPDCAAKTTTVTSTTYTRTPVFDAVESVWKPGAEVAGTPVVTVEPITAAEKAQRCGIELDTDPKASQCTVIDGGTDLTSWLYTDTDPRVIYTLRNVVTGAVTTPASGYTAVPAGRYEVTAVAADGWQLKPEAEKTWTYFVENTAGCGFEPPTLGVLTPTLSIQQPTCTADGSYTLGGVEGTVFNWTVTGPTGSTTSVQNGTYAVTAAGTYTFTAANLNPRDGFQDWSNPQTRTFSVKPSGLLCDELQLTTLAFTGSGGGLVAGGIAVLLMVAGAVFLLVRRRMTVR